MKDKVNAIKAHLTSKGFRADMHDNRVQPLQGIKPVRFKFKEGRMKKEVRADNGRWVKILEVSVHKAYLEMCKQSGKGVSAVHNL